ncbi:hypothetical protein KUCAC02_034818 [Chaenocephalus aceratus]|nr:hypothetical protein KUCAC02_034818 [Chaenocephalus aceratus]
MEIRIFSRVGLRRSSGGTEAEEQEVSECLALKSSFSCPHNKHQLALRSPGERTEGLLDLRSPGEGQRVSWSPGEREDRGSPGPQESRREGQSGPQESRREDRVDRGSPGPQESRRERTV